MNKIYLAVAVLIIFVVVISCKGKEKPRMPVYIQPYYNSEPLTIQVGEQSEKLMADDPADLLALATTFKNDMGKVNLPTLYVLAIRLYDVGKKDEAVYWFYTAQYRTNIFKGTIKQETPESAELIQSTVAFKQLSGEYINGYAFGDLDKNIAINRQMIKDNAAAPGLSKAYPNLQFDDAKLKDAAISATQDKEALIKYINENRESIKTQRKANGIEGKY
jgi:hypothetical protein